MRNMDPILDLPLSEGGGTTVYDRSGHNHHGETFNVIWERWYRDWIPYFDGGSSYIALDMFFDSPLEEFTVIAWVKIPLDGGEWSILDFDRSEYFTCAAGVTTSSICASGDYAVFHTTSENGVTHDMWSNSPVRDGKWHCIAWRFNSKEAVDKKIYIDGVLDASADAYPTGTRIGRLGVTRYGFIGDGSEASTYNGLRNGIYYKGYVGEVLMFLKALSDSQISFFTSLFRGEKRSPP